jgi:hypothetical protein
VRRRLFNFAAAVSLMLCVATVVLWATSMFVGVGFEWWPASAQWKVMCSCSGGEMAFLRGDAVQNTPPGLLRGFAQPPRPPSDVLGPTFYRFRFAGFALWSSGDESGPRMWTPGSGMNVAHWPCWAPCLATAVLPACRAGAWWRRRGRAASRSCCPACGYDCRATPERCPECGTEVRAELAR